MQHFIKLSMIGLKGTKVWVTESYIDSSMIKGVYKHKTDEGDTDDPFEGSTRIFFSSDLDSGIYCKESVEEVMEKINPY